MKDIVSIARSYVGQTEKAGNSGFTSPEFEKKMKAVGWSKSLAWCAFTGELIWKEAYAEHPEIVAELTKLFSGSATATFKNFDLAAGWEVGQIPKLGALIIWRFGNGWQGHLGVVTELPAKGSNYFKDVEGNTNDKGGREGYIIAERKRPLKVPFSKKGLNIVGFVYPKKV